MTEYCYPDTKDSSMCIPLYHHEQVPFQSIPRQDSFSFKQAVTTNPASCELQDVILYYQSQPELLHLILLSKLEEDKRRAEEAKLRAKELDLLLLQNMEPVPLHYDNNSNNHFSMEASPPVSSSSSADGRVAPTQHATPRRDSTDAILASPPCSTIQPHTSTSQGYHTDPEDHEFSTSTPIPTSSASMLPYVSHHYTPSSNDLDSYGAPMMSVKPHAPSLSFPMQGQTATQGKPYFTPRARRRRREMQAITKIVETRDYPYVDGYFWKNNGNTVQRKTGNKSIYYKCSNGTKGCPVNKTVTRRENGEFLIKYRGEHLPECGRVQRIVDV